MHEMSLAMSVLQIVEDAARPYLPARVTCVRLEIGALAAVEPDALRFCFDAATRGSLAEGAALEIEQAPGRGLCLACAGELELGGMVEACPLCGEGPVQAIGGTQMRVRDFEIA